MSLFLDPSLLWTDDVELVNIANRKRILLSESPSQSDFRVYCILVIETEGKILFIDGSNSEQGYIGGAICAERAALVQLRHYVNPIIKKIVIVTDSISPIAPGVLCREYLMSHAHPDTDVVISSCCGENISKCKLGELYPHPYLYRNLRRNEVTSYAFDYSSTLCHNTCTFQNELHQLHYRALEVINNDNMDGVHPIKFSAAVKYQNGDIDVTWFLKALEYGNSLDPVSQLVVGMEKRKYQNKLKIEQNDETYDPSYSIPTFILMTDQYGVCHAPFATARSLLTEHGYGDIQIVVKHHPVTCYETCTANELVPLPTGIDPLSHDDFISTS